MITLDVFLFGLMAVSTLTGLVTEAIKKVCAEHNRTYHANTIAGIVAVILSIVSGIAYIVLNDISFSASTIVYLVMLTICSWLGAMVGYDKVIATIKNYKKGDK